MLVTRAQMFPNWNICSTIALIFRKSCEPVWDHGGFM